MSEKKSLEGRLILHVRRSTSDDTLNEVELAGNRAGLLWLAELLVAIAHADKEEHTHLDNEASGPMYYSPEGWWLTISLTDGLPASPRPAPPP